MAATPHRELAYHLGLSADSGKVYARMFREGMLEQYRWLVNALGQPYRGWDGDADGAMWYLLRMTLTGLVDVAIAAVGETPAGDHERERNQSVLNTALEPFQMLACVDQTQHAAESDGHVHVDTRLNGKRWGIPLDFIPDDLTYQGDIEKIRRNGGVSFELPVGPLEAPLEIGYTDPSRTFLHLCRFGAVARWPYKTDRLVIIAVNEWGRKVINDMVGNDLARGRDGMRDTVDVVNQIIDAWRVRLQLRGALAQLPPGPAALRYEAIKTRIAKGFTTREPLNPAADTIGDEIRERFKMDRYAWGYASPDALITMFGRAYQFFHPPLESQEFMDATALLIARKEKWSELEALSEEGMTVDLKVKWRRQVEEDARALQLVASRMLSNEDFDTIDGHLCKPGNENDIEVVFEAVEHASKIYGTWPVELHACRCTRDISIGSPRSPWLPSRKRSVRVANPAAS